MVRKSLPNRSLNGILMLCYLTLFSLSACAIDNPDAPNYKAKFLKQANEFEERISQSDTTQEFLQNYSQYEVFLDKQLNQAYRNLQSKLSAKSRTMLTASQRQWIQFRDAEFALIKINWNRMNFGSSSVISRGQYRTSLIKQRVLTLLNYLQNYS